MPFTLVKFLMHFMNKFEFLHNESLKNYCTFHIGGNAKYLYVATTKANLVAVCRYCKEYNIKYKIIGLGANLLFDDSGFDGLIIVNKTKNLLFRKNCVYIDSGVNLTSLIFICCNKGLGGLSALSGIPSTIGGAIVNALGAFNCEFADFVEYVECYHISNLYKKLKLSHDKCKFSYRSSLFKNGEYIITRAKLKFPYASPLTIKEQINEAIIKKSSTQPLDCFSAGSVFKHGHIIPAKVIDELGLKGTKVGGAEISTKHAGFIVNSNSATSKDVKELIDLIKHKVKLHYNANLELEIEFVNN